MKKLHYQVQCHNALIDAHNNILIEAGIPDMYFEKHIFIDTVQELETNDHLEINHQDK